MRGVNGLCGQSTMVVSCGNRKSMGYACIRNANFGCQVCRGLSSDVEPLSLGSPSEAFGRSCWA